MSLALELGFHRLLLFSIELFGFVLICDLEGLNLRLELLKSLIGRFLLLQDLLFVLFLHFLDLLLVSLISLLKALKLLILNLLLLLVLLQAIEGRLENEVGLGFLGGLLGLLFFEGFRQVGGLVLLLGQGRFQSFGGVDLGLQLRLELEDFLVELLLLGGEFFLLVGDG